MCRRHVPSGGNHIEGIRYTHESADEELQESDGFDVDENYCMLYWLSHRAGGLPIEPLSDLTFDNGGHSFLERCTQQQRKMTKDLLHQHPDDYKFNLQDGRIYELNLI